MKIRKIASETTIKSMKANTPIHMYHYGTPSGKYKTIQLAQCTIPKVNIR